MYKKGDYIIAKISTLCDDLLKEKDCLWDVNKKDYHKLERAFEEIRNILDIDVAEIKAKITSLRSQPWLKTQHVVTCCEGLHTSANIAQQEATMLAQQCCVLLRAFARSLTLLKYELGRNVLKQGWKGCPLFHNCYFK